MSRIDGVGGRCTCPRDVSLRCRSDGAGKRVRRYPLLFRGATYRHSRIEAVALMVMDWTRGRAGCREESSMSRRLEMETPTLPRRSSPSRVGVVAHLRRQVEGDREPFVPAREDSGSAGRLGAEPKPAYWRMVQSLPRYIVGWTPRVRNSPGTHSTQIVLGRRCAPACRHARAARRRAREEPDLSGDFSSAGLSVRASHARLASSSRFFSSAS